MHIKSIVKKRPFVVSGPCSAESLMQINKIADQTYKYIDVFRAGIWKPRTNPNSFEGVGKVGLKWLNEIQSKFNIKVATEVGTAKHVELCLDAKIDVLWIGARTTVNPFYVQEISEALKGVNIPVLVKNPIHPEIGLWIGAFERLYKSGLDNLTAVHRGFYSYGSSVYRNDPKWEIPIELKSEFNNLPIICDASHIAGKQDLILEISQIAMDLDMNGLMIEVHSDPKSALSDSEQQITPNGLKNVLRGLIFRDGNLKTHEVKSKLVEIRDKIDKLDEKMVITLKERENLVKEIARFKLEHGVTIFQLERWYEILKNRKNQAEEINLDKKIISDIFEQIHKFSIATQTKIMK